MRDFDEFSRKLDCRYKFYNPEEDNGIHPFRFKIIFEPIYMNDSLLSYIDRTILDISSIIVKKTSDNFRLSEWRALQNYKARTDIDIKRQKNMCVVMRNVD